MGEAANIELVQRAYAAFGRGDFAAILALLAPGITWEYPIHPEIPWGGVHEGHQAVKSFFSSVFAAAAVEAFEPQEFVAQNDRVVVLGRERVRVKTTSRVYKNRWVHYFRIHGSQIAAIREYVDTAAIAAAFQKPPARSSV